jgi:hypothetical protein
MNRSFDPFYRWLGIPPEEQPPNHYRLLGLQLFEGDPGVVETAADRQMAHLRTFQTGPHADLSQQLLNQVAAARICLLNAEKKTAYDAILRRNLEINQDSVRRRTTEKALGPDLAAPSLEVGPCVARTSWEGKRAGSKATAIATSAIIAATLLIGGLVWIRDAARESPQPRPIAQPASQSPTSRQESARSASPGVAKPVPDESPTSAPGIRVEPKDVPQTASAATPPMEASQSPSVNSPPPQHAANASAPASPLASAPRPEAAVSEPRSDAAAEKAKAEPPPAKQIQKAPLPAEALQEKILAELEEVYRLADAKTDEQKCRRARELVERARKSQDNPNERFVFFRRAMELASEGSDAALMLQAVDLIGADFTVDVLLVKQKVLVKFAASGSEPVRIQSFLENVDKVVGEAMAEDRYELALELLGTAERLCQRPQGRSYRKRIHDRHKQVQQLSAQWDEAQEALDKLKTQPTDPAANLELGRWYCLAKADWPRGLAHLAKGSDPALRALAKEELTSPPKDPEGQVTLADAWWEQAQRTEGEGHRGHWEHAADWYKQALPGLSGLTKTRVEKRLAEIAPGSGSPETRGEEVASGERGKARGHLAESEPPGREPAARMPGKVIPETIDQELRLPRQGGPYKLTGRVTITPQGALLIERGTTILAAPGAAILARGPLSSYGEGEGFVRFRPSLPQAGWDKLSLERDSKQVLERFDVRGANRGLYIDESVEAKIKDCLFLQNRVGVETKRNDKPLVRFHNCLIANNATDGITLHLSHVELDHCTVAHNGGIGINLAYYGSATLTSCHLANNTIGIKSTLYEGHVVVKSSNLVNQRGPVIEVKTPQDYQCQGNYWGTTNREQIGMSIVDGLKKPGCGVVVFQGYLAKPVADAGCSLKVPKEK